MLEEARAAADMPEDSVAAIDAKRRAFERLFTGKGWVHRKPACDLYVAAFFTGKTPLPNAPPRPSATALPFRGRRYR